MSDYFLNKKYFKYLNLYCSSKAINDFEWIELCKTVVDNQVGYISVPFEKVENTWNWLELSDVNLCGVINNFDGKISVVELFNKIKKTFNSGADIVEIIFPPYFFDVDVENIPSVVDDYLSAIEQAKGNKKVKVTCETGFLKLPNSIKGIVYLFSLYHIDIMKTASGLYSVNSSIADLNAALEEARSAEFNISTDFLFNPALSDKYVLDDACRLAEMLLDEEKLTNFSVSCSLNKFLKTVGKSTC